MARSNGSIEKQTCIRCGASFSSRATQCPKCRYMNINVDGNVRSRVISLADVPREEDSRVVLQTGPWDICFGEPVGLATDQVVLIAGSEGGGKSTKALHICGAIAGATQRNVFYMAAEESARQIARRADRLRIPNQALIKIYGRDNDADLDELFEEFRPSGFIVDSLQGYCGMDASTAVALCKRMKDVSIKYQGPTIIVSQLNKDDDMAGVRAIAHEVDTVCHFSPVDVPESFIQHAKAVVGKRFNKDEAIRQLHVPNKNRYGASGKTAYFAMTANGLVHIPADPIDFDDEDGE